MTWSGCAGLCRRNCHRNWMTPSPLPTIDVRPWAEMWCKVPRAASVARGFSDVSAATRNPHTVELHVTPKRTRLHIRHHADTSGGTVAIATHQSVTILDGTTRRVTGLCPLRSRVTGVGLTEGFLCACTADRGVFAVDLGNLTVVASHKDPLKMCVFLLIAITTTATATETSAATTNPITTSTHSIK